ncbi:hypothetical protein QQ045_009275 [Rhodiola kirilowii]
MIASCVVDVVWDRSCLFWISSLVLFLGMLGVGTLLLLFRRHGMDYQEKHGYIVCEIKKQYALFDAKVVSKTRKGPVKGKKKA